MIEVTLKDDKGEHVVQLAAADHEGNDYDEARAAETAAEQLRAWAALGTADVGDNLELVSVKVDA